MLVAILHFIQDEDKPAEIITTLVDALPPGSYVVASHLTGEHDRDRLAIIERDYRQAGISAQWRDSDEFARLAFTGLQMVPPGVVLVSEWRPDAAEPRPTPGRGELLRRRGAQGVAGLGGLPLPGALVEPGVEHHEPAGWHGHVQEDDEHDDRDGEWRVVRYPRQ